MKTIEIGKRLTQMRAGALQFSVPKVWVAEHGGLESGTKVFAQYAVASREIRYFTEERPGRIPMTLTSKSGAKTMMLGIPSSFATYAGVKKGTPIVVEMNGSGTLIVRAKEEA